MKYIVILLFLFCGAINAQAQCPGSCHNSLNPAPPTGSYWTVDTTGNALFLGSCGDAPEPCQDRNCNEKCVNIAIWWRGCCDLDSITLNFDGCVKVCAEAFKPTHPSWPNSNGVNCRVGPHVLSATFTSDRISTCEYLIVRVCGPAATLPGMGFDIIAKDCDGSTIPTFHAILPKNI